MDEDDAENSSYFDLSNVPIEIEEVDTSELPESELAEFVVTDTISLIDNDNITIIDSGASTSTGLREKNENIISPPQEEVLIKKLIDGELTFSQYKAELGRNDEDIEHEDYEELEIIDGNDIQTKYQPGPTQSRTKDKNDLNDSLGGGSEMQKTARKKRSILPPALQGLMGQGNLCYARGEIKLAENVCLEIIRQVPLAPEPFLTLAQIYENTDMDKFMQFSLIAAHLNPGDTDLWLRISDLSLEQGNVKQAITSLSRAIKANPRNLDIRLKRIGLLESIGEDKFAFRCYYGLLNFIPKESGEFLLSTAKKVAEKFHRENNMANALDAMEKAYSKIPELFQIEDINIYCELLISNQKYKKVLDVLSLFIGFPIDIQETCDSVNNTPTYVVETISIPEDLILDFRTKLIVALVHLRTSNLFNYLIENALKLIDVEEGGDCHLDIAEALMKESFFNEALRLLIPLVVSQNFSLAAVWLRHADCYRAIGQYKEAIESYKVVVELAPQHLDARLTLSALLKQTGKDLEALKYLEQDPDNDLLDPKLLYERCYILKETKNYDEYLNIGMLLISRHCVRLRNREEKSIIATILKFQSRLHAVRDHRTLNGEDVEDTDVPEFSKTSVEELTLESEWGLYKDMMKIAFERKNYSVAEKLAFMGLSSRRFRVYKEDIEFYALMSSTFNQDSYFAYKFLREYIIRDYNNPKLWNVFNIIIQFSDEVHYHRFLNRFFGRVKPNPMAYILLANYFLVCGTYKYALNDFISIYKQTRNPMLSLLCGIALVSMAFQKIRRRKQLLVKQAIGYFTRYETDRMETSSYEVNYNFGRLYHQIGMMSVACAYYQRVLDYDGDPVMSEHPTYLDLKREAAFNLHLIYKSSGNFDLARKVLYENIVV